MVHTRPTTEFTQKFIPLKQLSIPPSQIVGNLLLNLVAQKQLSEAHLQLSEADKQLSEAQKQLSEAHKQWSEAHKQ